MIFHVNPLLEASRLDIIGKLGIFNVNRLLEDDNDRLRTMEPRLQLKRSPSLGIKLSRNPARSTDQR